MGRQKAIFLDRDGTINIDKNYLCRVDDLELYSFAQKSIERIHKLGFLCIVISNQSVIARNICTIEELDKIHKSLKEKTGRFISDIYYCPHYPYLTIKSPNKKYIKKCTCRKPAAGLFFRAAKDWNIDLSMSYMIGDSDRDIWSGKQANCHTIGVRTGKNTAYKAHPNILVDNLWKAVEYIESHT